MRRPGLIFFVALAALVLGESACTTASMSVPMSLAARVDPFEVTGANPRAWNRPLSFGPWQTVEVREGLQWGFARQVLGLEAGIERQAYRLVLEKQGGSLIQAECVARELTISRSGWSVDPAFGSLPALACGLRSGVTGEDWALRLYDNGMSFSGEIVSPGRNWTLRSVHMLETSRLRNAEVVGFEIDALGESIGAVETINRGRVWMRDDLTAGDDAVLAATAAALLLYEPLSE